MKQNIICQSGKCFEESDGQEIHFEGIFRENNIVDDIEKDLWKKNLGLKQHIEIEQNF